MSILIFWIAKEYKPSVTPESLTNLAATWEMVRSAAVACEIQAREAINRTLAANQGPAIDAFEQYVTGQGSAAAQLGRLAEAASQTRDAHNQAAALVTKTVNTMDAIAASTAKSILESKIPIPTLQDRYIDGMLERAKTQLSTIRIMAFGMARSIYEKVSLPSTLELTEAETRGSIPKEIEEIWQGLNPEQRRKVLDRIADDVLSDWPTGEPRPEIYYYSNQKPQPPGTIPPPGAGLESAYGAASGGDVYLNYDIMADPASPPSQMSTVVHEIQHIQQQRMRDEYNQLLASDPDSIADIRAGLRPDPFVTQGSTIDEVERFMVEYEPATINGERNPYYYHQPKEIDSRRAGTEYLDGLTPEQMTELFQ